MKLPRISIKNYHKNENKIEIIDASDIRRIRNVLRLRQGSIFKFYDGSGKIRKVEIEEISRGKIICKIIEELIPLTVNRKPLTVNNSNPQSPIPNPQSPVTNYQLSVGVSLLKQRSWNLLLQKLTELAVSEILPFVSSRTIVKIDNNIDKKIERWYGIVKNTISQADMAEYPEIYKPMNYKNLLEYSKDKYNIKLIVTFDKSQTSSNNQIPNSNYEQRITNNELRTGNPQSPITSYQSKIKKILFLIGPEGGFTEEEEKMAVESGFIRFPLFSTILRSETAAIAAAVILMNNFYSGR